jgi:hypothetical protein
MSRSIGEPLSDDTPERAIGPLYVINSERNPLVVAEVELAQIPLQMLLADVMIDAIDAAFQDREISLDRVGVGVATDILFCRVIHSLMAGEALADRCIEAALVSAQIRLSGASGKLSAIPRAADSLLCAALPCDRCPSKCHTHLTDAPLRRNLLFEDRLEIGGIDVRDMKGRDATFALHKRDHGFVAGQLLCVGPVLRLAANISFIGLNELAFATQAVRQLTFPHCLANSMGHEPCGFQGDAKGPVKLVSAHPLLGRAQQKHRLQPDMQFDVAGLEDGSDLHGERFTAGIALIDADPGALAFERAAASDNPAMRADAAVAPDVRLNEGVGCFLAVILGFGQYGHRLSPWNLI